MNSLNISFDVCVPLEVYNFCLINNIDLRNYCSLLISVNSVNHMLSNHSYFSEFYKKSPIIFNQLINESE